MVTYKDIVPPGFSRPLTVGAIESGQYVSSIMLGGVAIQVFQYYRNFPNDPLYVRLAVGMIMVFLVVLSALLQRFVWFYTVAAPCDLRALDHVDQSLSIGIPFLGCIALIVQSMYSLRVWRITGSALLAIGCWSLALARFSMFLFITHISSTAHSLHEATLSLEFKRALTACLSAGSAADIAICICISVGLLKRRTGFAATDQLVDRVIAYTVGSGLLPTVVGVAELISYIVLPDKLVWLAFWICMGPALATSLIVSLNQRSSSRGTELALGQQPSKPSSSAILSGARYTFDKVQQSSGIGVELTSVTRHDGLDSQAYSGNYKRDVYDSEDGVGHQPRGHMV